LPRSRSSSRGFTGMDFHALVDNDPIPLLALDAVGGVRYANPAFIARLGTEGSVPKLSSLEQLVHADDAPALRSQIRDALADEQPPALRVRMRASDSRWLSFNLLARSFSLGPGEQCVLLRACGASACRDVAGALDELTGLPTRNAFRDRLVRSLLRSARGPSLRFALLSMDLDRFKLVNRTFGRDGGDTLLKAVADRLEAALRPGDLVAYLGGDEFGMLVHRMWTARDAGAVAQRICDQMAQAFDLGGHEVYVSASIGIVLSASGYTKPEPMLRDAETAMYRAKQTTPGRYELFDPEAQSLARERLGLETELRRGVERGEFLPHYQPIVSLSSGRIVGFEALARWQHPTRGLVGAAAFIEAAEDTGLIVRMAETTLPEACRQVDAWQQRYKSTPALSLSMNFSSIHFTRGGVVQCVRDALAASGLPGSQLVVEITESVMMENLDSAAAVLAELKGLGVDIHIDDFGTGYSSLSYLQRLPFDALKVDRSFIGRLGEDADAGSRIIVRAIVELARNLGRGVVAEGIENADQLEQLRELGCEHGQGYLFSRPVAASEVDKLLASASRQASGLTGGQATSP
jgi:diguanylate cyclase (GGDEF)-like protein